MKAAASLILALLVAMPVEAAKIAIDGELYSRRSSALMPPSVDDVWMFNITQLAPDGSAVKKGDVVVSFDASELTRQLAQKQGQLNEKQSQLNRLLLDLAERGRQEQVTTAEARAQQAKAQTKTSQPPELVGGIAYRKLMVERQRTQRRMQLALERERLAAGHRAQEQRMLSAEVAQLQAEVAQLQKSIGALNVTAPRSGRIMHRNSWRGEKLDVGSQVWRGQAVAEIPDPATLAVRAQLPERELRRVRAGMPVRIVIEGRGSALAGKVVSIGRTVRSKSGLQPVPILDLDVELVERDARLRAGQSVRVELEVQ